MTNKKATQLSFPLPFISFAFFMIAIAIGVLMPRLFAYIPVILIMILGVNIVKHKISWSDFFKAPKAIYIGLILFISLISISFSWSYDVDTVFNRLLKFIPLLAICLLFLSMARFSHFALNNRHTYVFVAFFLICCSVFLVEVFLNYPFYQFLRNVELHPNVMGASYNHMLVSLTFLYFPFFLAAENIKSEKQRMMLQYGVAVLLFVTLWFSTSESSLLALLIGFFIIVALPVNNQSIWRTLSIIFILLILSAPWLAVYSFEFMLPYLKETDIIRQSGAHIAPRMEIYDFVGRYIIEQPWTGYGIESARVIDDFDQKMKFHRLSGILHPHNFALQIWLEFGLIGATLAALGLHRVLVFLASLTNILPKRSVSVLTGLFFAILCVYSFGYGLWQGWLCGLVFTTIGLCLIIINSDSAKKRP